MNLQVLSEKLKLVSDIYSKRFNIKRDPDWFILKIQEELGELVSSYLKLTQRGRLGGHGTAEIKKNLEDEIADVIAMTLLFAYDQSIDVEAALRRKWLAHLETP